MPTCIYLQQSTKIGKRKKSDLRNVLLCSAVLSHNLSLAIWILGAICRNRQQVQQRFLSGSYFLSKRTCLLKILHICISLHAKASFSIVSTAFFEHYPQIKTSYLK